jgi:hypothetical protein
MSGQLCTFVAIGSDAGSTARGAGCADTGVDVGVVLHALKATALHARNAKLRKIFTRRPRGRSDGNVAGLCIRRGSLLFTMGKLWVG